MIDTLPPQQHVHAEVRFLGDRREFRDLGPDASYSGELLVAYRQTFDRLALVAGVVGSYGSAGGGGDDWADGPGPEAAIRHWSLGAELQANVYATTWFGVRVGSGVRRIEWNKAGQESAAAIEVPLDLALDFALASNVWAGPMARVSIITPPKHTGDRAIYDQRWVYPGPERSIGSAYGLQVSVRFS